MSKAKRVHIRTLHYNSFASVGPALFNAIPKKIKAKETLTSFKAALDKYLKSIPDKPPISGYPVLNGNSITEWTASGHYSPDDIDDVLDDHSGEETLVRYGGAPPQGDMSCI